MFYLSLTLMMTSNFIIYLDLYLTIKNPFFPRDKRVKYYIIFIVFMFLLMLIMLLLTKIDPSFGEDYPAVNVTLLVYVIMYMVGTFLSILLVIFRL